jgi:hypothetical protein
MAVDLGWPWWAFTTIAVCVGAASLLLFLRIGSRFARGVLATLLLESVVIAALAPALMLRSPHTGHPDHGMAQMRRSR